MSVALSVLDLVPVRADQTSADAVAATLALAKLADETGYRRYWLAEHHNMPAVAATSPPVLIGLVASATRSLRVGSGGVMLPNHAPLVVAEQFALLEAAFPGRIDLGVGRAPGTDPVTAWALRHLGPADADDTVSRFPEVLDDLQAMMDPAGVAVTVRGRQHPLRATPAAGGAPELWLLGSSDYAARLAARKGLPYVFAHHFAAGGQGRSAGSVTAEALQAYRSQFRPSEHLDEPRTFLTVNAAVAETREEAEALALPQLLTMVALRTGAPLTAQPLVEEAAARAVPAEHRALMDSIRAAWVIGSADEAREQIEKLAREHDVDEVMVNPVAGARAGADPRTAPGRERTLLLLAD